LLIALGFFGLSSSALSADSHAARPNPVYFTLYETMFAHLDLQAIARSQTATLISTTIERDPALQGLEKTKPQLRQRMQAVAEPYTKCWLERSIAMQQERVIKVLSARMSPAEAVTSARFYGSPLGRKIVQTIMRNFQSTSLAKAAAETGKLDGRAAAEDHERTLSRSAAQVRFTPAELRQAMAYLASPAAKKCNQAMTVIWELSLSQPPQVASPDEQLEAREAMAEAVRSYIAEP
jgi:hypothetical protein